MVLLVGFNQSPERNFNTTKIWPPAAITMLFILPFKYVKTGMGAIKLFQVIFGFTAFSLVGWVVRNSKLAFLIHDSYFLFLAAAIGISWDIFRDFLVLLM